MNQYKVRMIKMGSAKYTPGGIVRHIDMPGVDEKDAMRKAEKRMGADWGVISATKKIK